MWQLYRYVVRRWRGQSLRKVANLNLSVKNTKSKIELNSNVEITNIEVGRGRAQQNVGQSV